jgi:hypothetical protein
MTGLTLDLDLAMQQVAEAREWNDERLEGVALSMLAQALYEAGREAESYEITVQAAQVAWGSSSRHGIRRSQTTKLMAHAAGLEEVAGRKPSEKGTVAGNLGDERQYLLLRGAAHAYLQAERIFYDLDIYDGPADEARHGYHRVWKQALAWTCTGRAPRTFPAYNQLETRSPACSLGPFIEVSARQLGQQLGESTIRALERIHMSRGNLSVQLPGGVTTLVLPRRLTEVVRQATINLDLTSTAVRGTTLYWDRTATIWRQAESDEDARSLGDPAHGCWVIRYAWTVSDPRRAYPTYTYSRDTLCETRPEAEKIALDGARTVDDGVSLAEIQVRQVPDGAWERSQRQPTAVKGPSPSEAQVKPRYHDQGVRSDQRARVGHRRPLGAVARRIIDRQIIRWRCRQIIRQRNNYYREQRLRGEGNKHVASDI